MLHLSRMIDPSSADDNERLACAHSKVSESGYRGIPSEAREGFCIHLHHFYFPSFQQHDFLSLATVAGGFEKTPMDLTPVDIQVLLARPHPYERSRPPTCGS